MLFHKYKVHGTDNQKKGQYVVPMQILALEEYVGYHCKNAQTDAFLQYLELHKVERTAIAIETHAVGWHLAAVFKKGYAPRQTYNSNQGPATADSRLLQTQMPIPCQCHEDIAGDKQYYCI